MMFHAKKKKCNRCQIGDSIELKLKCCSQCKCTYYCNISCQRMDWQKHKLYCAEMRQNSIDLAMGTEFITTTEKWFLDHESTIQLVPRFKVLSFQEMEAISVEAKASVDSITKAVERHETPGRTIFLSLQCSGLPYPLGFSIHLPMIDEETICELMDYESLDPLTIIKDINDQSLPFDNSIFENGDQGDEEFGDEVAEDDEVSDEVSPGDATLATSLATAAACKLSDID